MDARLPLFSEAAGARQVSGAAAGCWRTSSKRGCCRRSTRRGPALHVRRCDRLLPYLPPPLASTARYLAPVLSPSLPPCLTATVLSCAVVCSAIVGYGYGTTLFFAMVVWDCRFAFACLGGAVTLIDLDGTIHASLRSKSREDLYISKLYHEEYNS